MENGLSLGVFHQLRRIQRQQAFEAGQIGMPGDMLGEKGDGGLIPLPRCPPGKREARGG